MSALTPAEAILRMNVGEDIVVVSGHGGPYKVLRIDRPAREGACFYARCVMSLPYKVWADGRMERPDLRLAKAREVAA